MQKTFKFGKISYNRAHRHTNAVEVKVELKDTDNGPVFSAVGAIWNERHTDWTSGGQNLDTIALYVHDPIFIKIFGWWLRYHLNGTHAGTPEQEAAITQWRLEGNQYDYKKVCEYLKSIGLYEVPHPVRKGETYKYGHEWLYRPIDEEDLRAMKELLA